MEYENELKEIVKMIEDLAEETKLTAEDIIGYLKVKHIIFPEEITK